MAILEILQYPDPRLKIKAKQVAKIDDDLHTLIDDMAQTMYDAHINKPGEGWKASIPSKFDLMFGKGFKVLF